MMLIRLSRRWSERSDGAIQSKRRPQDLVQSLRGRDFRFRPDTGVFETVAGRSQFGLAGDDWGNRFLSWNTIPIRHEVIPDAFLSRSTLLQDFLDPNRQIAPDYAAYEIIPKTGEPAVGLIASETAQRLTLRHPGAPDSSWARSEIREIRATGRSLMPEGLEEGLSHQDVADLLSFLRAPSADLLPKQP